jgi:uncharacterized membrane protein YhaH (DUF805 family)
VSSYLSAFKNYANFSGRTRRRDYWLFVLVHLAVALVSLLPAMLGDGLPFMIPFYLYFLATLVPVLALIVRRLHDTGKSGWWYLVNFVPLVGEIVFIVFMCIEGEYGPNRYGEDPREVR